MLDLFLTIYFEFEIHDFDTCQIKRNQHCQINIHIQNKISKYIAMVTKTREREREREAIIKI